MPENDLLIPRRTAEVDPDEIAPPPRAPFVELGLVSCFSFLRGASLPTDLVMTAWRLGYDAIGIADANSMAGVVRLHTEAKRLKLKPAIGCRIETIEGLAFLAYPRDRAAYGRLCRLVSAGRMATLDDEWQAKGACDIGLAMLAEHSEDVQLILLPPRDLEQTFTIEVPSNVVFFPVSRRDAESAEDGGISRSQRRKGAKDSVSRRSRISSSAINESVGLPPDGGGASSRLRAFASAHSSSALSAALREKNPLRGTLHEIFPQLTAQLPTLRHLAASFLHTGDDIARIERLDALARANGLTLLATNDVHYHAPERRPLHDVMTAIRHKTTVAKAGYLLAANAERHLKSPAEMIELFARWPHAIAAARGVADGCRFSLDELKYEYPEEHYPDGMTPQQWLEHQVREGIKWRFPKGLPEKVEKALKYELDIVQQLDLARYFLTIQSIVEFARSREPPILCQGRGSAANSAVCFCLGITSVDPAENELLFDRFISTERGSEPPDIDVDFEHERREEVIQHIYQKYGRDRAGLCATVIHYRPRMAIREVGKAMGLTEDVTAALARTVWGGHGRAIDPEHARKETGLDLTDPHLKRVMKLTEQMIDMPRHLSQHVGGFILTDGPLTETVPIGNGAMPERSFIEWDKDDIDDLGIMKLDILALGMLTCVRKTFRLIEDHHGESYDLATVPTEDPAVYDMLCEGDSLGVFQVESRAQMNMLPRLKPRKMYDLTVQVAIVRPGPIQGDMVHPYLKQRRADREGRAVFDLPGPSPEHGPRDELSAILGRTYGVPIFQEQAMKIAIDAARFSPAEANQLRKAMATFRSRGMMDLHQEKMVSRMVARGYDPEFAQRCFNQIKGFGEYGFPESHAASFALLVYVSSWLKCHYPAAFAAALLNSQPMGFYAPAQIVRDAEEHGVTVLPVDVNYSDWDCTLEKMSDDRRVCFDKLSMSGPSSEISSPLPLGLSLSKAPRDRWRLDKGWALRLGLRQVDGLPEAVAAQLVASRAEGGAFTDVIALRDRARPPGHQIERLAAADCFGSLQLKRRQALWDARALVSTPELPLFAAAREREEGAEKALTNLPAMPLSEEVVADYQTQRLSLKAHPLSFLRPALAERGFVPAAELRARKFRSAVQIAGVVLIRQRPGSAKGVCFITLEDETGIVNLVIWPDTMERYRKVIMGSRLMEVRGRVEYDDEVIHVIATHLADATHDLHRLSDDLMPTTIARADHCNNPLPSRWGPHGVLAAEGRGDEGPKTPDWQPPGPGNRDCGYPQRGHPRDVRIIPKSRDFH
ncbi:MAG: error-prone DNA polymerase [Qipengyuania sp.]|nr:error-prone DNA polymerase [Qipengyuania sp.]